MKTPLALAAFVALAACGGGQDAADNKAEALEEAADVSTPEAAEVLENRAETIREEGADAVNVQNALEAAGNAQAK